MPSGWLALPPSRVQQACPTLGRLRGPLLACAGFRGVAGTKCKGPCPLAVASSARKSCVCMYCPPFILQLGTCPLCRGSRPYAKRGEGGEGGGEGGGLSVPGSLPPAGCQHSGHAATCMARSSKNEDLAMHAMAYFYA